MRHGQYHTKMSNSPDRHKEQVLTSLGVLQAEFLGKYLTKLIDYLQIPVTKIMTSAMTRAKQTCAIATANMSSLHLPSVELSTELVELNQFAFCPLHHNLQPDVYNEAKKEKLKKDGDRFTDGFNKNFKRNTDGSSRLELYFVHANVIRYILFKILQLPLNLINQSMVHHCSVTHIEIKPNGHVVCHSLSDTGFMALSMVTLMNEKTPAMSYLVDEAQEQINNLFPRQQAGP